MELLENIIAILLHQLEDILIYSFIELFLNIINVMINKDRDLVIKRLSMLKNSSEREKATQKAEREAESMKKLNLWKIKLKCI